MKDFFPLWPGGPLFAQAEHFRLSTDCVLLADFVQPKSAGRGIDLGCASGAIALLILNKSEKINMTGLEILPEAVELARENMSVNGYEGRSTMLCGDIRAHRELFRTGEFDLAVSNPPYFPVGSGSVSPDARRAGARGEENCSLEDICRAAAFLLRTGGSFYLVHKPERLSEVFVTMTAFGIEPKRLRLVCHNASSAPNLVLIEGRRGGKRGLKVERPLILHNPDGTDTEETRRIYRFSGASE